MTKKLQQQAGQLDPNNYEHRESTREKLNSGEITLSKDSKNAYRILRNVRNALAHGTPSQVAEVQNAMSSEENLRKALADIFKQLNKDD